MEEIQSATKSWYAVYTRPRFEKRVYTELVNDDIEAYLPLQKTLRQWSDRKKMVEIPLLPSYVFVHISLLEYLKVLQTDGIVKYISFEGQAVSIPEKQINTLKLLLDANSEIECTQQNFKKGQKVDVVLGSLKGLEGELVSHGKKKRFLVRINQINQNLLVNIPANYLKIKD
ncbi:MAG: UpxY family transcription antiterminator [Bacteroidales bacterium]|nr:UpxY family transcription antiterminator [Bacteroidales bacterium]